MKIKINRFLEKIDFETFGLILLIILTSALSFSLGILSEREKDSSPIRVITQEAAAGLSAEGIRNEEAAVIPARDAGGYVVASKSGSKYHFPWCPGASQIKEENKVWFETVEEARAAGYAPAGNCKGLE